MQVSSPDPSGIGAYLADIDEQATLTVHYDPSRDLILDAERPNLLLWNRLSLHYPKHLYLLAIVQLERNFAIFFATFNNRDEYKPKILY